MEMEQMLANAGQAEAFLKLLANKHRLMILCNLLEQERSVSELNNGIQLGQSALSQHLATLRQAGLVSTRREAQTIYYAIDDPKIREMMEVLYQSFCVDPAPEK